ncbi:MAG: hypothetical protein QG656_196 [Candidatus Hydrogenedentes bacterium]|nr:hypothetical protein [Candidatus Hydrogenedentota bacterium]
MTHMKQISRRLPVKAEGGFPHTLEFIEDNWPVYPLEYIMVVVYHVKTLFLD